jgi:putative ABC transport system permease protein
METPIQLVWGLGLMALALALAAWQRLEVTAGLAVAAGRATLQLMVFGFLVASVFVLHQPWVSLGAALLLLLVGAITAHNQINPRLPHLLGMTIGALLVALGLTLSYTLLLVMPGRAWWEPPVLIPLVGLVVGQAMTGAALAGERLSHQLRDRAADLETHLSLGATPGQALRSARQDAIKAGLMPTLNGMTVAGLGLLPNLMAGTLLAGFDPVQAAAYQLLILFMGAFATLVSILLLITGIQRTFFTSHAQLIRW